MCEYCGDAVNNELLYESEMALLEIEDSILSYFEFGGNKFNININYCPMCGEPLSEEAKAVKIAIERMNDGSEPISLSELEKELYSPDTKSLYGRIEDEVNEGGGGLDVI